MDVTNLENTTCPPSRLGFGCARIASMSSSYSSQEVIEAMKAAFDQGVNFFDTADSYGQGDSERMLAKVFGQQRDRLNICTKAGYHFGAVQGLARWVKPLAKRLLGGLATKNSPIIAIRNKSSKQNFSPDHLVRAIDGSLKRLQTDYVDVFLLHDPPQELLLNDFPGEILEDQKKKGRIRCYGVSCQTLEDAEVCLTHLSPSVIQIPVNLLNFHKLDPIFTLAKEKQVRIIGREPFANGNLFSHPSFLKVAGNYPERSPAQIALRFILQYSNIHVVLPSMLNIQHLRENISALSTPPFSDDEMNTLSQLGQCEENQA